MPAKNEEPETVAGYWVRMKHAVSGGIVFSDAIVTEYADVALRKALDHLGEISRPHGTHLLGAFIVEITPTVLTVRDGSVHA
jgi:hypothetical protein